MSRCFEAVYWGEKLIFRVRVDSFDQSLKLFEKFQKADPKKYELCDSIWLFEILTGMLDGARKTATGRQGIPDAQFERHWIGEEETGRWSKWKRVRAAVPA